MACSRLSGHIRPSKRVYFTLQWSGIKLVRPLSTVDSTHDYARVSHSRQWSNYNFALSDNLAENKDIIAFILYFVYAFHNTVIINNNI